MNKIFQDLQGNPLPFLAGAAIGYYYADNKMKEPTACKRAISVIVGGISAHLLYGFIADKGKNSMQIIGDQKPVIGVKQTK